MKNRIFCRVLAGFVCLAALLTLAACSSAPAPAPTAAPQATANASRTMPEQEQRRILEENRSLWSFGDAYYTPWFYTFTDLDHNGWLEVLAASTQGTGIFTYANFYEVAPDGSGVKNLYHEGAEIEGPDDWPEIILESLPCYYDRASDTYYYACSGVTRDGAAHSVSSWAVLCLKDGVADWEYLGRMDQQWTDGGEGPTVSCTDAAGNPITEQDFDKLVERRFAGLEQSTLRLNWIEGVAEPAPVLADPMPPVENSQPAALIQPEPEADVDTESYVNLYSGIIQAYKTAYESGNSQNPEYLLHNGLSEITAYSSGVGYALRDLDRDGTPELIIAGIGTDEFAEGMVYDLYTLYQNTPAQLAVSQARNRWYLRDDNLMLNEASGGAGFSFYSLYRKTGTELSGVRSVFTWFSGEASDGYYRQEGTVTFQPDTGDEKLTQDTFEAMRAEFAAGCFLPPLTPIG